MVTRRIARRLLAALLPSLAWSEAALALDAPPVTTRSLIAEMADLEHLTRYPGPGVRLVQFSSYDRRSNLPGGPGWFANSDGFGGEPIPGFEAVIRPPSAEGGEGEYLIGEVQQPGAIVRTWTAGMTGTIRVYLDGADQPVFDGPAEDFLKHRASTMAGGAGLTPAARAAFEERYADYFPIPFANGCRIVWAGKLSELHFYHVDLRLYPAGTAVTTFRRGDGQTFGEAAEAMAAKLRLEAVHGDDKEWHHTRETIPAHSSKAMLELEGPGCITLLEARVSAKELPAALRGTLLRIAFDGYPAAQVVAPLGDFFAAGPGVVPYETLPMSVEPNGTMRCRFAMPYATKATIALDNRTGEEVNASLGVVAKPYAWDDRSMHFHTRWSVDHDLLARGGDNAIDLPFLHAEADGGLYVGTAAILMNPCPVPTAGGNWWGEGDEKVFVDAERRPSIFGTGSEDYFNYAWSESDLFHYPFFAQPICTGPDTRGHIANCRWHILDAIPFDRSIDFSIELFAHTPTPHLSYARLAYWYGRPGAHDSGPPIEDADLRVAPLVPWTVVAAGGARDATIVEAEAIADPKASGEALHEVRFSAGEAIRLRPGQASLTVKAPADGRYRVVLTCLSGPQPVSFRARLDGTPLAREKADRFELATPHVERLVNLWCDPLDLKAGEHVLTLDGIAGDAGLVVDFVWLKPSK